jgi:hypothetical protein
MGRMIYGRYSDNVVPGATKSVQSGSGDADYPAANLGDLVPAIPAQLTTTTGAWKLQFGAAQRIDIVAIPHHNLDAGLNVRFQGNAADAWGSPTLDAAFTIPAYRKDGFPYGAWIDLTAVAGYSAAGFQYWRLVIVGVNSQAIKIGELVALSEKRTLNPNISWGAKRKDERPLIENVTDYLVSTIYDLGVTRRSLAGDVDTTDAGLALIRSWWEDTRGRARPFLLIPDESVNDAWFVRWGGSLDPTLQITDRNTIPLDFQEVSRGLYL